jgi:hypothetical protein
MQRSARTQIAWAVVLGAAALVGACDDQPAGSGRVADAAASPDGSSGPDAGGEPGHPLDAAEEAMKDTPMSEMPPAADANDTHGDSGLLPQTTKGYELWAWEEGDVLWFTLVTGTNRAKTVAEVTEKNVETIRGEHVYINRSGWDQLAQVLALVPPSSFVGMPMYLPDMPPLSDPSHARIQEMLEARWP